MRRNHLTTATLTHELARTTHGLVSRQLLRTHGIDRHALRRLTEHGEVAPHGGHAVRVCSLPWDPQRSPVVAAVINSGPNAWAEGRAALVLAGLTGQAGVAGQETSVIDVGVPENAASRKTTGVRRHRLRYPPPLRHSPVMYADPAHAALHAAAWARSDAEAAAVLASCVQQALISAKQLHEVAQTLPALARRGFIRDALQDLARRHPSLIELDLPRLCRRHGLPEPDAVTIRQNIDGEFALEGHWDDPDITVVVDAAHHDSHRDTSADRYLAGSHPDAEHLLHVDQSELQGHPQDFFVALRRALKAAHPETGEPS